MAPLTLARFCLNGGQRWLANGRTNEEANKEIESRDLMRHHYHGSA